MTVPVVSRTTTSDQQPEADLQREQLGGVDAGQPGGGEQLLAASRTCADRCAAAAPAVRCARSSSSPTPEQQAEQRPGLGHAAPTVAEQRRRGRTRRRRTARRAADSRRRATSRPSRVVKMSAVSMTPPSARPGQRDDLAHPPLPGGVGADVHDEVDAGGDGGDDERRPDVLPGQQRQRAHLDHGLAGAVRVQRAHAGQPGVQRDQQVEALLLAHLADDDAGRAASAAPPSPGGAAGSHRRPRGWAGASASRRRRAAAPAARRPPRT